jgi:hypothetical protein
MLLKERKRLKDIDPFTILDYIKTSIEILMNMKREEEDTDPKDKKKPKHKRTKSNNNSSSGVLVSDTESMLSSTDDPPKDYEAMLQKYEGEVRNHIKIE